MSDLRAACGVRSAKRIDAIANPRFVVLFIHQEYDALWEKFKGTAPELFMAWGDCGLIDERGRSRPALAVRRDEFKRPLNDE